MAWQFTPYTLPLAAAAIASAIFLVLTYRNRNRNSRGAVPLIGVFSAATIWSLADCIRVSTTSRTLKIAMNDLRFVGPILATVSVFLFAAAYTNREEWLDERRVFWLFGVHVVTVVLLLTNGGHHLVRQSVTLQPGGSYTLMEITWGPWYYVHAVYSYVLLVGAVFMFVDRLWQSGDVRTYRGQTLTILGATFVPWAMNAAFIAGITEVDLTAIGFTVTGSMFAVAVFRYQILDLVPIARSTVVDSIDEGYLVLDTRDIVVDVNRTATSIVDRDREAVIGADLATVFADHPAVLEQLADTRNARERVRIDHGGDHQGDDHESETRYYDVDVSPIYDRRDRYTGRVVLFRDITDREQRKRQLEQQKTKLEHQNERLEEFAGIVSHDLRNPINVVSSRLELARMDPDEEHFDSMEEGLERMEAIIDDVLAMARQGQTVEETEPVDLAALCTDAWDNVDTKDAEVHIDTERTVEGDETRLLQVFENLFRNAIDHGGEDVSVAVGDLPDGFYIEDDGPGIPEDQREEVLEKGYTTARDGTGFGLSIVKTAIEAHGWEIRVTEGIEGGARFEITDVGDLYDIDDTPGQAGPFQQETPPRSSTDD